MIWKNYVGGEMNSFGRIFRISIFGESHGKSVGILIDGCPHGMELVTEDFHYDMSRRKPGAKGTTPRIEKDTPILKSGVFEGKTAGSPILIEFENSNTSSKDYSIVKDIPRPGHADFTAFTKYSGYNDYQGGGHFSGRLTAGIVAAGVIAKKIIPHIKLKSELIEIGGSKNIDDALENAISENDSVGGIIECCISGLHVGMGEPFFDSVESLISHMMFSIPAVKGIDFGAGFKAACLKGSENNDMIEDESGKTSTNNAGGINGGITNGNDIKFRIAVKPTPSIGKQQTTFNMEAKKMMPLSIKGRHDVCIALRMPVIIEAAAAIVLADLYLIDQL